MSSNIKVNSGFQRLLLAPLRSLVALLLSALAVGLVLSLLAAVLAYFLLALAACCFGWRLWRRGRGLFPLEPRDNKRKPDCEIRQHEHPKFNDRRKHFDSDADEPVPPDFYAFGVFVVNDFASFALDGDRLETVAEN